MALNPDHHAIVIGVESYAHFPPLRSAAHDARAFAEWLMSSEGGGLPPANVSFILSPPALPADISEVRPRKWEIDRALLNLGAKSGERIGKRLYFYFSGHVLGTTDDVGLLMADASPQNLGRNLGLSQYRRFLRSSGLFDEVVYVLDGSRKLAPAFLSSPPSLDLATEPTAVDVADLLLVSPVVEAAAAATNEPRGALTQALLEGLRGQAANPGGSVTSTSLAGYVRERVRELTSAAGVPRQPEIEQSGREILFTDSPDDPLESALVVEVPHWTAQVLIFDDLLRPVPDVGPVAETPRTYESKTRLRPGIYQVRVSMGGQTEEKLIFIRSGRLTRIGRSEWKSLKPASAALLAGSAKLRDKQTTRAVSWSKRATWRWPGQTDFDSSLFLFVSALDPRPVKGFADGLILLQANGEPVVELDGEAVRMDLETGWMAFCAELPAGYYVLRRRHRRGLPVRHQPVYLAAGWQTQLFVPARRSPLLREHTLNMAPANEGFRPKEETAVAVAFVMDSLRQGGSGAGVVLTEHVNRLLEGEKRNPWLGVLAGYALLRSGEAGLGNSPEQAYSSPFEKVLGFLESILGDHPDVAALRLRNDHPASASISYPPLLLSGLQRVQRHAMRFEGTIPLNSLTDCVLDSLETNSPWTAWRDLVRTPRFESEAAAWDQTSRRSRRSHPAASSAATPTISDSIAQSAPPSAPIFRLAIPDKETAPAESATAAALCDAPLIGLARDLLHRGGLEELPETFADPTQSVGAVLQGLTSQQVSAASGLPLERTEHALDLLRQCVPNTSDPKPAPGIVRDAATEAQIAPVAREVAHQVLKSPEAGAPTASDSEAVSIWAAATAQVSITIEECVSRLRAEVRRMLTPAEPSPEKEQAARADDDLETVRALSERLLEVADALLVQADFVAITDKNGGMDRGNGAFQALLGTPGKTSDAEHAAHVQAWQEVFRNAEPGHSTFTNPAPISRSIFSRRADPPHWELRRAAVEETGGEVRAFLNFLRVEGAPRPDAGVLLRVDALLSRLTLFASLYALGSAERRQEYIQELDSLIGQLESAVHGGAPQAAAETISPVV